MFLQTDPIYAPSALMHNLKHNRVLHDILVFITVDTSDEPRVPRSERVTVKRLPLGAWLVEAHFGYMEQPDVPAALRACEPFGLSIDPRQASYFLGRRALAHVAALVASLLAATAFHHARQSIGARHRVLPDSA